MIKDLVVNLAVTAARDAAAEFAISIAETFAAHVAGIAFAYEPAVAPTVVDGLSAAWIDTRRSENRAAAEAAIERFETGAKRAGSSAEHRLLEASFGAAPTLLGSIARRFDLSVVGQTKPDGIVTDDLFIEAALFESGRPVVVAPYIQTRQLKLERVLVCWDAGRSAARAVGDAMPFLQRSKSIQIVTVSSGRRHDDEILGADIGEHLARHGLNIDVKELLADDIDVTNAILSHAADSAADFIVMGGYGHTRIREFVFGGTTLGMLKSMTVPTLMSH
jgi:nucleotide-binding universal stress UspA family protein